MRYVLEGSVRRSGSQVRVNAQLIDAETNAHLWAERFDRDTGDLFALQNEITGRIAVELEPRTDRGRRPPDQPSSPTRSTTSSAGGQREQSQELVPTTRRRSLCTSTRWRSIAHSVATQSRLAAELAGRVLNNMTDSRDADIARAEELAGQALTAEPRGWLAHYAKGQVLARAGAVCRSDPPVRNGHRAQPQSGVMAISCLGQCKYFTGSLEDLSHSRSNSFA